MKRKEWGLALGRKEGRQEYQGIEFKRVRLIIEV